MSAAETYVARTRFAAPAADVFRFHERPGALARLNPPFDPIEVVESDGRIDEGARTVLRAGVLGPMSMRWDAEHKDYKAGRSFVDVQAKGPFAEWEHLHEVEPDGEDACYLTDRIRFRLPLGAVGRLGVGVVRGKLERAFAYRHAVLAHDLALHQKATRSLRVAISGASGLLGRHLTALLETGGHEVLPLVRRAGQKGIAWDPANGTIDAPALEGLDAVVHLAGESIAQRWTSAAKARIRSSRWDGTRLLAEAIAGRERPPAVFVSASAVGFYGDREEIVDERASPGDGFLAEVCRGWEDASKIADVEGVRLVNARIGVVLTPLGGALASLRVPFSMGVGGRVGDGRQGFSWVSIDDAAGALYWSILDASLSGPVNLTGPEPVDNRGLTKALGDALGRPTVLPLPAAMVKLAFGQMGVEALLSGVRAVPRALLDAGYPFAHRTIDEALAHVLGTNRLPSAE